MCMFVFLLCVSLSLTPERTPLSASAPPQGCPSGARSPGKRERERGGGSNFKVFVGQGLNGEFVLERET